MPDNIQSLTAICQVAIGVVTLRILWLTNKTNEKIIEIGRNNNETTRILNEEGIKIGKQNLAANQVLKQMDIFNACSVSYDQLIKQKLELKQQEPCESTATGFYERYWELQHNQFIFWQRGYIEDEIMLLWMRWRHDEMNENLPLMGNQFGPKWGWERTEGRYKKNTNFTQFMFLVFHNGAMDAMKQTAKRYLESESSQLTFRSNKSVN